MNLGVAANSVHQHGGPRRSHFASEGALEGELRGNYAGLALSPAPPRLLKDVLLTTNYAQGHFPSDESFWDKGGAVRYRLYDPVSDTEVFQWHSARGAQGQGF